MAIRCRPLFLTDQAVDAVGKSDHSMVLGQIEIMLSASASRAPAGLLRSSG